MDKKHVLIVEDEPLIAAALCRVLRHPLGGGHQVETCPRAELALTRLRQERLDLIITGLHAPDMGGLEFIRCVRQLSPQTHILLTTAYSSPEVEHQAQRLGIAYLAKPFGLDEFLVAVQCVLDGKHCQLGVAP
jgi:two-component system response regulator PilR (NtrC family)